MDEKHLEILEQIEPLFMKFGIKSLTMDDIAKALRVSKKTLYKYVKDKSELVEQVMQMIINKEEARFDEIAANSKNAIDENFEIVKCVTDQVKGMHPSIFFDMEKYYPEAWEILQKHKQEYVYECLLVNMKSGIKEGLYRKDLNYEIIAKFYIGRMNDMFNVAIFPPEKYNFMEVFIEMIRHHIRGIASEKGIEYLKEKVKKEKSKIF